MWIPLQETLVADGQQVGVLQFNLILTLTRVNHMSRAEDHTLIYDKATKSHNPRGLLSSSRAVVKESRAENLNWERLDHF